MSLPEYATDIKGFFMASHFRISPLWLAVLLLGGLLVYLNLPQEEVAEKRKATDTPVSTSSVISGEFPVVVEALGTARANEAVILTAQKEDIVEKVYFEDGDLVKEGQLLLTLDAREERARVNELEINLQEAKRQLKRISDLARESVASEQLLDEQQARVKALKAQLEVANAQLAELELRAPFSGKLGIRQVSVGALVSPGDVVTTLDDLHQIKVDFSISEAHLPTVANGQEVAAKSIAYPEQVFDGTISSIDSRVDPLTRAIQVRAILDNADMQLRPGMLLQINLQKQILNATVVPERALVPIEDKQYVFVVEQGKAVRKEVVVGRRKPGIAQIVSGLEPGEQVVVEGTLRLRDGASVAVLHAGVNGDARYATF